VIQFVHADEQLLVQRFPVERPLNHNSDLPAAQILNLPER